MKTRYINRELSWLDFNGRVLQEAADPSVPLIERLRFLGIYYNNLDEFYKVRYATLRRALQMDKAYQPSLLAYNSVVPLLREINKKVLVQSRIYDSLYNKAIESLAGEGIYIVDETTLLEAHEEFLHTFFTAQLAPSLMVLILDKTRLFPQLKDSASYLAVKMRKRYKRNQYAFIELQTKSFGRFICLPSIGEKHYLMYLEDVIRCFLPQIFSIYDFDQIEAHSIKITRDADLSIDSDIHKSFVDKVAESVQDRKKGEPVRLVYDRAIGRDTLKFLKEHIGIDEYDHVSAGARYHNRKDLVYFPNLGRLDLEYKKIKPLYPDGLKNTKSHLKAFEERDYLLYTPYQDYAVLLNLLREAAIDQYVRHIKITIYRVSSASKIINALINAARNGKKVTVVIEIQARFDEALNIHWANILQEEGVSVIHGIPGLKVHSKIGYIEKQVKSGIKRYAFLSTGNFNERTAKIYTDYTLFTTDIRITKEVDKMFTFFEANYRIHTYRHLVVSPRQTRKRLIQLINNEIHHAQKDLDARINMKMNSLSDKEIIDKLYLASQAGVKVRLLVRGICSLMPQVSGLSDNIEVVSIVDKFLEHPRIFWFANAGNDLIYISSADLMTRNLDYRVEVSCPVYQEDLKQQIIDHFEIYWSDNTKARISTPRVNTYKKNGDLAVRAQVVLGDYFKNKTSDKTST